MGLFPNRGNCVGKCPACNGILREELDAENKLWAKCQDCGARFPMHRQPNIILKGALNGQKR